MTRRITSRNKISKQYAHNIWGVSLSGNKSRKLATRNKTSIYGQLLQAKQLIKRFYGELSEKQFRSLCLSGAQQMQKVGDLDNGLRYVACLLECRLDVSLYRSNMTSSIFLARQLINHSHVMVNGLIVKQPGFLLSDNDLVEVVFSKKLWVREQMLGNVSRGRVVFDSPSYLQVDYDRMAFILLRKPFSDEIKYPLRVNFKDLLSWYS